MTERFVVAGPDEVDEVFGMDGAHPAGVAILGGPGMCVTGYRSHRKFIELEAAKLREYLDEEGLERVKERRQELGESGQPGREWYSRCAKSLIEVGGGGEGFDGQLGFPLELAPERNPYRMKPGEELPVRVLFQGQPLAGALVVAHPKGEPGARTRGRTDDEGRVWLRLGEAGAWLIAGVHMERTPAGSKADWESWWGTLTFAVPGE